LQPASSLAHSLWALARFTLQMTASIPFRTCVLVKSGFTGSKDSCRQRLAGTRSALEPRAFHANDDRLGAFARDIFVEE
jgi:hypothetical protein